MKHFCFLCMAVVLSMCRASAQFVAGPDGITFTANTLISINGVELIPSADLTIEDNELTFSITPIPGSPPGISKVYHFENPITFEGTVGMYYLVGDLNGNTETSLELASSADGLTFTSLSGSTVNTVDHFVSNIISPAATIKSVTASQLGALPVTLSRFEVKKEGNTASLSWETTYEQNSDFFEVQRSSDAKHWQPIGKVMSWIDSYTIRSYSFSDESPVNGENLYRLKMVDKDGSFAYSGMRSLRFDLGNTVSLYPNPTSDIVKINANDWKEVSILKLLNSAGKTLYESGKNALSPEIELKKYPSGVYFVQLVRNNGNTETLKVLKR